MTRSLAFCPQIPPIPGFGWLGRYGRRWRDKFEWVPAVPVSTGGWSGWYFHPENWGRFLHCDSYFSKGLKLPTSDDIHSLKLTAKAPENWCLEDAEILLGWPIFRGYVSFREGTDLIKGKSWIALGEYPRYIPTYTNIIYGLYNGCIGQYGVIFWQQRFLLGGGFNHFLFSPRSLGEMIQIDYSNIFQMGWWKTTNLIGCDTNKVGPY